MIVRVQKFMNEQIAKVKEIIDRWGLKPGIMYDDYLDKPSEIYSRLMELRFNNNLDPNHEYTLEEVQELRNKNHTGDYLIRTENQFYNWTHRKSYRHESLQRAWRTFRKAWWFYYTEITKWCSMSS